MRPNEPAKDLLERMARRNVLSILVTTKRGELVGAARREDLQALVEEQDDD